MRAIIAISVGIFAIAGLFTSGQIISIAPEWLKFWIFSNEYITSLGPEIGGSGLDAFLVGGVAGLVASQIGREREFSAFRRDLSRRKANRRPFKLEKTTERWSTDLDLSGIEFNQETIEDRIFANIYFSKQGASAKFTSMTLHGCDLSRIRFGNRHSRGTMKDTKFQDCTVRNSSFENLDFKNGGNAFLSSRIEACRFDGANLENVALDGAVFVDCTFWGTRFKDLKLPDETWNALTAAGLLVTDGPKQHTVQTLDEALRSLTPRKAAYVARALFVDFVRKWLPAPERWPKQPAATGDAKPPADA